MKILSFGVEGGSWKLITRCDGRGNGSIGCGAQLEVNAADLFHTAHYDYGGGSDHYVTFECLGCHEWNDLAYDEVPSGLRSKILSKEPRSSSNSYDRSEK